jgi:hypothetical protein
VFIKQCSIHIEENEPYLSPPEGDTLQEVFQDSIAFEDSQCFIMESPVP